MTSDKTPHSGMPEFSTVSGIAEKCRDLALDLTLRNPLLKLPKAERSARLIPLRRSDAEIATTTLLATNRNLLVIGSDCSEHEAEQAYRSRTANSGHLRLQVDLPSDKLAARLSKIRKQNEELIEKRGVPCGYAISHVLHWISTDGQHCEAPLALIPVDIRDELDTSRLERRIVFAPGDRDTAMNPVLFAYLRHHFNIEVPPLEEGPELTFEEIERWARQLDPICKAREGWRIERSAAVGLFDCGAISVDCDPANWNGALGESATLAAVLLGKGRGDDGSMPAVEFLPQTLVLEADGSQLNTLKLAAQGANLVIHGPPGSGKSQTIVNLIAQAMAAGKSVLFVAQKPEAALVVLNRLKSVGLDPFCTSLMPVGSGSKSNMKHSVLDGLTKRLRVRDRQSSEDLQKRARLNQAVQLLEDHVGALRYVLPQFGRAARELVADLALFQERRPDRFLKSELVEPASPSDFAAATVALQNLATLRADIPSEAVDSVGGIGPSRSTANPNTQAAAFLDLANRLAGQLELAARATDGLKEIGVKVPVTSLSELADWADARPALSLADDGNGVELAARLHRHGGRGAFDRLSNAKRAMRTLLDSAPDARHRGKTLVATDPKLWEASQRTIVGTVLAHVGVESLSNFAQALANAERRLRSTLLTGVNTVAGQMLIEAPGYPAWRGRLTLLGQLEQGFETGSRLCAAISKGAPTAAQLYDLAKAIRRTESARAATGRRLSISAIPCVEQLERLQAILTTRTGVLSRIWAFSTSKDYRQACTAFKQMVRLPIKRRDWGSELQAAIELRNSEQSLAKQAAAWGHSGESDGVESLEAGANWLVGIERTAQAANVPVNAVWEAMRDRRDPTLESAEKQIGSLCAILARDGQLLQAMNAAAGAGNFRLQRFLSLLVDTSNAASLAAKQAAAWEIDRDMDLGALLALGVASSRARAIETECASDVDIKDLLADEFAGIDSAIGRLELVSAWHKDAVESARPDWQRTISDILTDRSRAPDLLMKLKDNSAAIAKSARSACQLCEEICASFEMRGQSSKLRLTSDRAIASLASDLRTIKDHEASIPKIFRHHTSALSIRPLVGAGLINRYLDGSVDCLRVTDSFQASSFDIALRDREELFPIVDFDRLRIERSLADLRETDADLRQASSAVLRGQLAAVRPPPGVDSVRVRDKTDLALIRHVTRTPNARLDLTGLYKRAGAAIRALQPCTIATPTSVSEYLPRQLADFDLVIIDEASQVEPASAIGSIARGSQVIIVGDPKQLPPTNFFGGAKSSQDEGEDGDLDDPGDEVADAESILNRAIGNLSNVHLRGHYRSKHHSLIDFSNRHFYDSQLVVPPSTAPRSSQLGVVAHHVEGAFYSASENAAEAQAVAQGVLRHLRNSPGESLGVVAFNVRQADLIEQHITALARRSREDFEAYARACDRESPLFVRSLESVQGDERDVIFISYTYGRDPVAKVVHQRFGPLTQRGGGRRLNVLVTRARNRVEVFHSLLPEDIKGETGGVPFMRAYLHHAMRAPHTDFSEGSFESDFEAQVAKIIEQINPSLVVKPQVGCEGFRIDLGVALQSAPHRFILGIECDGATYHSEPNARQRDMIRQTILEHHGWTIHRIWSTAWWHNFAEERSRLTRAIEKAMASQLEPRAGDL
jgi:very-short-patch-repair endonuclease